jgi:hypothetical protein
MYYLKLRKNNRIAYVATYYDRIPDGMIAVSSYPKGKPISDYLYVDDQFIYDPLPRPDPEPIPESEPDNSERLDAIEAAIMDIASAIYGEESEAETDG